MSSCKVKTCKGNSKSKLPCLNKVKDGSYCYLHKNQEKKLEKPEYCVVCTEELDNNEHPLRPCGHWVHKICQVRSGRRCVLCRGEVEFTENELKVIEEDEKKKKIEEEERNLEAAMNLDSSIPTYREIFTRTIPNNIGIPNNMGISNNMGVASAIHESTVNMTIRSLNSMYIYGPFMNPSMISSMIRTRNERIVIHTIIRETGILVSVGRISI